MPRQNFVFGWLKEGHFFRDNQKPTWQGTSNKLKNFIYLYGRNIADFLFLAQTWWGVYCFGVRTPSY